MARLAEADTNANNHTLQHCYVKEHLNTQCVKPLSG